MNKGQLNTRIILFSLWLLMFAASSQFFIMSPILSQIGEQLHIPESLRGTLITAYAITLGIIALITGPISDRIGRRKILLIGAGAMAVSLLMHQLAIDYWSMLGLRILAGLAGGILTGSCVAYIGDYFPCEKRGWANGVIATGSAAGQILGIPAGTVLAGEIGFFAPFQFFGFVMVFAFLLILWKLPQPQVSNSNCPLNLTHTIKKYWEILHIPSVKTIAMGYLLMFLSISSFIVYFPTWLENSFHANSYNIAVLFLIGGLATVFTGPISGMISDKTGRKQIIIFSNLLLVIIMPLSVFLLNMNHEMYYAVFFIIMLLIVARMIPFQALASEVIQDSQRGRMMSMTISIGQLGMAMGSGLSGLIYTQVGFIGNATLAAMASFLMAFLIQKFIPEKGLTVQGAKG
ncbi:MFS transporter [Reichenbachiella carrageenanivorans]|uniref:MFS transporter n=1 Tax=Reichenbachiella carrageenanivorans TaxID=2979869 RepID=A0ABY6D0J3_9BACT|nr:MFS transporter [Reichenbachiella carrageenanivorans]UXX79694.1 MFS transporter [Reichenbachiella carrageenanivorans]